MVGVVLRITRSIYRGVWSMFVTRTNDVAGMIDMLSWVGRRIKLGNDADGHMGTKGRRGCCDCHPRMFVVGAAMVVRRSIRW